jgi:hypothetical protein
MLVNFTTNHTATYTTNTIETSIIIVIVLLCSFLIGITSYCIRNFLYYKSLNNNNPIIPINDGNTEVDTDDNDEIKNDVVKNDVVKNDVVKNDEIEITIF